MDNKECIMPLEVYNYDCPYCGGKDTISFVDSKGNYTMYNESKTMSGARCMNCGKEFAIIWELRANDPSPHHKFTDMNAFIDSFINSYENIDKRDIDAYVYDMLGKIL